MHLKRFSFAAAERSVVIEAVRVEARMASIDAISLRCRRPARQHSYPDARAWFGAWVDVPLAQQRLDSPMTVPALIGEPTQRWSSSEVGKRRWLAGGELMLDAVAAAGPPGTASAPVVTRTPKPRR